MDCTTKVQRSDVAGTKLDTRIKVGVIGGAFRRLGASEARKRVLVNKVAE